MKRDARRSWLDDEEWDEEDEELTDEEEGHCPDSLEVEGPSYAPVFTGLLNASGQPIIRHPVVMKVGFHPEESKYHAPTMDDNGFDEADGRIFGWVYET